METIDFGPSTFAQHSPSVSREEMESYGTVEIPDTGDLDPFPEHEITNEELVPGTAERYPSAIVVVISSGGGYIDSAYLIYSYKRKEWIAVIQNSWHESSAWGWDDSYSGPYAINDRLSKEIAKAYSLPPDKLTFKEIVRMPPEMLKMINK